MTDQAAATDAAPRDANCAATDAQPSAAPLDAFVNELSGRHNDRLPAVQFLLKHGACTRCCLRFAGRTGKARLPDTSRSGLLETVAARLQQHAEAAAPVAVAAPPAATAASSVRFPAILSAGFHRIETKNPIEVSLPPTSTAAVPAAAAQPALVPDSPTPDAEPAAAVQEPDGDTAAAKPDTAGFSAGAAAMQVAAPSAGDDSVPAPHVAAPAVGGSAQPAGGGAGADTAGGSRSSAAAHVAGGSAAAAAAAAAFHSAAAAANGAAAAPAEPAAAPQATAAADPVCPLCLGLLQSLDAGAAPPPQGGQVIALPDMDAGGGTWRMADGGAAAAQLAECVRREGLETAHCSLSLSVPAATQLRQLAVLHALKEALPGTRWLENVAAVNERLPDIKGALRHALGAQLGRALGWQVTTSSDVAVSLMYMHPGSNAELDFLLGAGSGNRKRYKRRRGERGQPGKTGLATVGRAASDAIARSISEVSTAEFLQHCRSPPASPAHSCQVAVKVVRAPVWVAGRYRKLGRDISNSPWLPGKCRTSVSEELARGILETMNADSYKFNSAGREDFDVRMLGGGRPFTLEFANSRPAMPSAAFFAGAQAELNGRKCGVEAVGLRAASRADATLLKEGEEAKQKSYRAVCRLSAAPAPELLAALNAFKDIVLAQKTPVRVSHRRADLVRSRTIYSLHCEMVLGTEHHCILDLKTQAGTYIKEFVHSDEGRTTPSLGSLLNCSAEILQLDVVEIHMEF